MRQLLFHFQCNLSEKTFPPLQAGTVMTKIVMAIHVWTLTKVQKRLAPKMYPSFTNVFVFKYLGWLLQMIMCNVVNLRSKVRWCRKMQLNSVKSSFQLRIRCKIVLTANLHWCTSEWRAEFTESWRKIKKTCCHVLQVGVLRMQNCNPTTELHPVV